MGPSSRPLLRARWRHLAMVHWQVEPSLLAPLCPAGTELDPYEGRILVGMVGFLFLDMRFLGLPVPFHQSFEELNLRFYVRRAARDGPRHGVVFVREIVSRPMIAYAARALYHEPYVTHPTGHRLEFTGVAPWLRGAEYSWRRKGREELVRLVAASPPQPMASGSLEEFLTVRPWGYNRQSDGTTLEYEVEHPRWNVSPVAEARVECDFASLYGPQFAEPLSRAPFSSLLADGSDVGVFSGRKI